MKYKTEIIPDGNEYVGKIFLNEEVIYTSNPHRDPIMVTRELASRIATLSKPQPINSNQTIKPSASKVHVADNTLIPITRPKGNPESTVNTQSKPAPNPPPRKCCGRG